MEKKKTEKKKSKTIEDILGKSFTKANIKENLEFIPTGLEELDRIIFICGGLPRGRAIEIAGKNNTGKSTFMQWCGGQVQKQGGKVAWFDAERCFLNKYAEIALAISASMNNTENPINTTPFV